MESQPNDYSHIKGWGHDADPENDPTYPMKHYTGDDHLRIGWERPTLQRETVEIMKSNERPTLSAAFGTSAPPSGLSGKLRRYAFKYSESEYGHWLNLLLADRINMVEGLIDDLSRGHIPNIFAEKGMKADLKYNKAGLAKKLLITGIVAFGVVHLLGGSTKKKKKLKG